MPLGSVPNTIFFIFIATLLCLIVTPVADESKPLYFPSFSEKRILLISLSRSAIANTSSVCLIPIFIVLTILPFPSQSTIILTLHELVLRIISYHSSVCLLPSSVVAIPSLKLSIDVIYTVELDIKALHPIPCTYSLYLFSVASLVESASHNIILLLFATDTAVCMRYCLLPKSSSNQRPPIILPFASAVKLLA